MESDIENSKKKGNKCSKCKTLIKEHEGPHGPRCDMDELAKDDGENEEETATTMKETRKEAEDKKQIEERLVKEKYEEITRLRKRIEKRETKRIR